MRTFILTFILSVLSSMSFAVDIITDKDFGNGRVVKTRDVVFAKEKGMIGTKWEWGLSYVHSNDSLIPSYYTINLMLTSTTYEKKLNAGQSMLLKFANGDVMELYLKRDIEISSWTSQMIGSTLFYHAWACYEASEEEMQKIINNEIIKIRYETNWGQGYVDIAKEKYTKLWIPSPALQGCYRKIHERMKVGNTIYDNF